MSTNHDRHVDDTDRNDDALVADLLSSPVSRRWLLKLCGSAAVGLAAAEVLPFGGLAGAPDAEAKGKSKKARGTLHFALGALPGVTDLTLHASPGARHALRPHTAATRGHFARQGGLWAQLDHSQLTHFVADVELPTERGMLFSVHGRRGNRDVLVGQTWHVPRAHTVRVARALRRLTGSHEAAAGSPERLRRLGVGTHHALGSAEDIAELDAIVDHTQTAVAFTMCHPSVSTIDPTAAAATKMLLGGIPAVATLGSYIDTMQNRNGTDWATLEDITDADGSPSQFAIGGTTTTLQTIVLNRTDATFRQAAGSAVTAGIVGVRDTAPLGAVIDQPLEEVKTTATWVQPQGLLPETLPQGLLRAAPTVQVKHRGTRFGTKVTVRGPLQNSQVPLRVYNNFVRWVSVYVQYLDARGQNLSLTPNPTGQDTKYAQHLALMPQVFTVLGVPIWDTNHVDVTLTFPPGAVTARLLMCGLGSDLLGGSWRKYFPADAYHGRIAPTDEVLAAALTTGLLTIGVNVFALASDIQVTAVWSEIRSTLQQDIRQWEVSLKDALNGILQNTSRGWAINEQVAAATVAGAGTYALMEENGFSAANLWNVLLALAKTLPKLLFNPAVVGPQLVQIGFEILGLVALETALKAVPIIGQVLAAVALAGDIATLAEVSLETALSPWVIDNEVSATYTATVTIARDIRAATFPVTATAWTLEAIIDGATGLVSTTGTINAGGRLESDPIVATVAGVPFGGTTIQWSLVLTDKGGRQVGTGASAKLANNDAAQPPESVAFAITQLPAALTEQTRFVRDDTTIWTPTASGPTWSNAVTDEGTRVRSDLEEVTGITVSTLYGQVGYVWKQNDRYYIRNAPIAENGNTIELLVGQTEGFARRPFLLYDSFVGPEDGADSNHVLLEPDATGDGYHVRRLTFDPAAGVLKWDPATSWGFFPAPISAAALHAGGRIVTVDANSGRLGLIEPYQVDVGAGGRPALASYKAGPGVQPGLLQSPVAVAITNPGVVLVLEAGANQVAAFDLHGDPLQYFSGGDPYRLPLAAAGTYLDLAVDGSGFIYVLYYTGDGTAPGDYHIDVYTASGTPLVTMSPGTNVARLAVDYWRSVYGVNFTALARVDPALGVLEPSISRFDPLTPALGGSRGKGREKGRSRS